MAITEQCPGCGEDVTTKRGSAEGRMCPACQRKARNAPKPQRSVREYPPIYDAMGFSIGYMNQSAPKGVWLYFLDNVNARSFPVEPMRYQVMGKDYTQSPSLTDHGCFDNFDSAKRFADSLIPDKADRVEIWDGKRGYMVAVKLCP